MKELEKSYVWVMIIDGNVTQAIKMAVASFQRRQGGKLPSYIWCPPGMMPERSEIESWRQRGVTISSHPRIPAGVVWAGPVE